MIGIFTRYAAQALIPSVKNTIIMGNKEVRPVVVSYEDAHKRVSPSELKRLKEAFKRCSTTSGYMACDVFHRQVLGEGFPKEIAEQIFHAFGGTIAKGISFKDLLCGLVLFTRARETHEEKLKFLFGLYADETLHIQKENIDRIIAHTDGQVPESLSELFEHTDSVDYSKFKIWLRSYPEFSSLSNWLLLERCSNTLTSERQLPSFYQTLAGVTHLMEEEIIALEKKYWSSKNSSQSGKFDLDLFKRLVSPPIPRQLTEDLYKAFDENKDGHIDFKELVCGISACCKGPEVERQKFCFRVFDSDRDGFLSKSELLNAIEACVTVIQHSDFSQSAGDLLVLDPYTMTQEVLQSHCHAENNLLTQAEYLIWAVQSKIPQGFSDFLFEVCHVVLGLKPASREDEGQVVKGWLNRELKRGYHLGQTWYIISQSWWLQWLNYVSDNVVLEAVDVDGYDAVLTSNHFGDRKYNLPERSNSNTKLLHPSRPGPIDNSSLCHSHHYKVPTLTNEGGILKANLEENKDYRVIPDTLFQALYAWYGAPIQLPRPVIVKTKSDGSTVSEIELHQVTVKLLKHQLPTTLSSNQPITTIAGFAGGITNIAMNAAGIQSSVPKRVLTNCATFSKKHTLRQISDFIAQRQRIPRDDLRLWKFVSENNLTLLEGDEKCLEDFCITDGHQILMEVRNKDLTWPEELLQVVKQQTTEKSASVERGVTGLSNLGNTCFMNSALQCVSNTRPLTEYFRAGIHQYELNRTNPLGMKGNVAQMYGELVESLWNGTNKSLVPLKLRWTLAKYAPQFNGFQQHDAQELLAFLLDGLHEDLNRVQEKPYVELKDSDGRPDEIVAQEAWENHLLRNQSVIVDMFHGQLKSMVKCRECSHTSVRFDPFNYLSLPLPMEACLLIEAMLIKLDGTKPIKFGFRQNVDDKYYDVKASLSEKCGISKNKLVLVELNGSLIKAFPSEQQKLKQLMGGIIYAYELSDPLPEEEDLTELPSPTKSNGAAPGFVGTTPSVNNNKTKDTPVKANGNVPKAPDSAHSSSSNVMLSSTDSSLSALDWNKPTGFIVAMHRKTEQKEFYFLAAMQSVQVLFGRPIILPNSEMTTHKELYHCVWRMIERYVTGHPVTESCNHAQDCDGSLGNEYPFILKMTKQNGAVCSKCAYYRFCQGCTIDYTEELFESKSEYIAIDWETTALHLRYQASQELEVENDESVLEAHQADSQPVDLHACLTAFTKEEQLAGDELYYCSKCKEHRLATKMLQIWRLPPILIIHLKRFQFHNGRWVKSHKSVDFPLVDFDPESYLAPRLCRSRNIPENSSSLSTQSSVMSNGSVGEVGAEFGSLDSSQHQDSGDCHLPKRLSRQQALSTTSCDSLDYSHTKYHLYGMSCHRGVLGGGHYVAYTKNPNKKWYEFNDSMVKEVHPSQLDKRTSYILFYERDNLNYQKIMPDIRNKRRDTAGIDEEFNTEYKKSVGSCCVQ